MPLDTLFSNPNPSVSRSRAVLSRFVSPLSKHTRNLVDFSIEPESPWKIYSPGEIVKGTVVLTVARGFDVTHLVVSLHGFAKVFKHQVTPGEGLPAADTLATGKGSRGFEYHGNGLATLFQDEIVLCGSGFLKKQVYKFGFELEFPRKSLPSSIDFERGTVSYIISATLTRPTAIAPTISIYKRVNFQDLIEIGHISASKPQVISLEPIARRGKPRKVRLNNATPSQVPTPSLARIEPPLSPTPSEDTTVSATSTSSQSFQIVDSGQPRHTPSRRTSETRSSHTSASTQTITATASILKQGALPGDPVPISITVSHVKPNVRGVVICTLYRQGRVDMHPAIPLGANSKGKQPEYEDVYPRSRTGLGGLYFSNGSPSGVFRKDLSQSSTMMVIDPGTLTADIKTSVRIPDDAFPTISNVPGGMIAFQYYIEVVIDLCGKLGETRFLPRLTSSEPTFTHAADNGNHLTSAWADSILDTAQLRRTRSVVDFTFMLVLGTKDCTRVNKKPRYLQTDVSPNQDNYESQTPLDAEWEQIEQYEHDQYLHEYDHAYDEEGYDMYNGPDAYVGEEQYQHVPPTHIIPPPQPEEEVDEKTRLRRQEELLLPSQPPQDGEQSSSAEAYAPTAPVIPSEDGAHQEMTTGPSSPRSAYGGLAPSTRSIDTIVPDVGPRTELRSCEGNSYAASGDDKQELERQRLLAQASAPPADDETADQSARMAPIASLPTENDEEYNAQTLHREHLQVEHLPQYER